MSQSRTARAVELIESGVAIAEACRTVGISRSSYDSWKRRRPDRAIVRPTPESKMTEGRLRELEDNLRLGMPIKLACQAVGMAYVRYLQYKSTDPVFSFRMEQARAQSAKDAFQKLRVAESDPRNWAAIVARLKLSFPEEFAGPTKTVEAIAGDGDQRVGVRITWHGLDWGTNIVEAVDDDEDS